MSGDFQADIFQTRAGGGGIGKTVVLSFALFPIRTIFLGMTFGDMTKSVTLLLLAWRKGGNSWKK